MTGTHNSFSGTSKWFIKLGREDHFIHAHKKEGFAVAISGYGTRWQWAPPESRICLFITPLTTVFKKQNVTWSKLSGILFLGAGGGWEWGGGIWFLNMEYCGAFRNHWWTHADVTVRSITCKNVRCTTFCDGTKSTKGIFPLGGVSFSAFNSNFCCTFETITWHSILFSSFKIKLLKFKYLFPFSGIDCDPSNTVWDPWTRLMIAGHDVDLID